MRRRASDDPRELWARIFGFVVFLTVASVIALQDGSVVFVVIFVFAAGAMVRVDMGGLAKMIPTRSLRAALDAVEAEARRPEEAEPPAPEISAGTEAEIRELAGEAARRLAEIPEPEAE